ncbi:MAG: hypothetical protein JWL65_3771 [Gammaproteobacteria bacterium]|nr:hypothetical protein [Gammaproteobacteria bacterium]
MWLSHMGKDCRPASQKATSTVATESMQLLSTIVVEKLRNARSWNRDDTALISDVAAPRVK